MFQLDDHLSLIDDPYLRRAAQLALLGRGTTSPNPQVGCVLVRDGIVVGEGFHERAGGLHAEARALADAGDDAVGATAYVTLEPCAHEGKTPPCADALVSAGIARVVIGMPDPNPVARGGAARLREAGVEVEFAADPSPFEYINRAWLHRLRTGLPWVTVKLAQSLDGALNDGTGRRISVTGDAGRQVTLALRDRYAAVAVGRSTVEVDDPSLLRSGDAAYPAPRVILCGTRFPRSDARLLQDVSAPTIVVVPARVPIPVGFPAQSNVSVVTYDGAEALTGALRAVAEQGLDSVLVEAGPRMFTALWEQDLIDELVTVTAGGVLGGCMWPTPHGALDGIALRVRMRAQDAFVHRGVAVVSWVRTDAERGA